MAVTRILTLSIALALWLPGTGAAAQPSPSTEGEAGTAKPPATGGEQQEQAAPPPAAPTRGEPSPFDYRPSEQISEDLSVSFPVDI